MVKKGHQTWGLVKEHINYDATILMPSNMIMQVKILFPVLWLVVVNKEKKKKKTDRINNKLKKKK